MKNKFEIRGDITAILLNSPKYGEMETIISTKQLEKVEEFPNTWYPSYNKSTNGFYVVGNITTSLNYRRVIGLHSWIKEIPKGLVVDHINHNTLDNTDSNLRLTTNAENMQNRRGAAANSVSGIRGVYWHKAVGKWSAQIRVKGKKFDIGHFDDLRDAEKAVIDARKQQMPFARAE